MTTSEAATQLGVSVRRVQAMIRAGRLSATKQGRDWHITQHQLDSRKQGRTPKGSKS